MAEIDPRFRNLFTQLRTARTSRERSSVARREMERRKRRPVGPVKPTVGPVKQTVEETKEPEETEEIITKKEIPPDFVGPYDPNKYYVATPPEPEVYQSQDPLRPSESVTITYEKPDGELGTITTVARSIDAYNRYIENKYGGRIITITSNRSKDVIYKAPTSVEWEKTMKEWHKKQFVRHGYVPEEVREQITLPSEYEGVKDRSRLEYLFEQRAFEQYLGVSTPQYKYEMEQLLGGDEYYMKYIARYGKDELSFAEVKKREPAVYLEKDKYGQYQLVYDVTRWAEKEHSKLGLVEKAALGFSGGVLSVFDFDFWGAVAGGRGAEYFYEKEYETMKKVKSGKGFEAWVSVQAPAYETVVLPLVTAGTFRYISLGAKVAKAGTFAGGAYKYFVGPATKVMQYGAIPTLIGADIGSTAAYEVHGKAPPGTTIGKLGGLATGFIVFGAGMKYWDTPSDTLTQLVGGAKKLGAKFGRAQSDYFPSYRQVKKYITQRFDVAGRRIRYKYLTPASEKLSSLRYRIKEQFPRYTSARRQIIEFKEIGAQRNIALKSRINYKLGKMQRKIIETTPDIKHKTQNILRDIKQRITPTKENWRTEYVKQLGKSKQQYIDQYVTYKDKMIHLAPKQQKYVDLVESWGKLKLRRGSTDLLGTKKMDYTTSTSPKHRITTGRKYKISKTDIARWDQIKAKYYEKLGSTKLKVTLSGAKKLSQTKLPSETIAFRDDLITARGYKKPVHPVELKAKPKKVLSPKEVYELKLKKAKTEFLKRGEKRFIKPTDQKSLQLEFIKTKYRLVSGKGGKIKVLKLEQPDLSLSGKVKTKGKTFKLGDLVEKKPLTETKKPTETVTKTITMKDTTTKGLRPREPLIDYSSSSGIRLPSAWALAAGGKISLRTLEFLEEGTNVIHQKWGKPKIDNTLSIKIKTDVLKEKKDQLDKYLSGGGLSKIISDLGFETTKKPGVDTVIGTERETTPKLLPDTDIALDQKQDLLKKVRLNLSMQPLLEYKQETDLITDIVEPPPPDIIPPPPFEIMGGEKPPRKRLMPTSKKETAYNVYVKERTMFKGKIKKPIHFKKQNEQPLTKSEALALGADITDNSPAISFKIKQTKGKAEKTMKLLKPWENIKHKFNKKGNIYIEKNKHRIDSLGEVEGISLLGKKSQMEKGKNVRYF